MLEKKIGLDLRVYWSIVGGLDLEQWLDCLTRRAVDGVNLLSGNECCWRMIMQTSQILVLEMRR